MRDYAVVSPQFWTGETGKLIKKLGHRCQTIALYLMTCPSSNMIGLYYLPLPTLCHETGSPSEGALKALRSLSEGGFAHYDEASEHVWVVNMAEWQIGKQLKEGDNRVKAIKDELKKLTKIPFYNAFIERYHEAYHLNGIKPLRSPSEAPPKPLRSQEQDQEQDQEKEKDSPEQKKLAQDPPPAKIDFDWKAKEFTGITDEDLRGWQEAYPAVDIPQEIKKAKEWVLANPEKRKKKYRKFLVGWFTRTQEKGGTPGYIPRKPKAHGEITGADREWDNEQARRKEANKRWRLLDTYDRKPYIDKAKEDPRNQLMKVETVAFLIFCEEIDAGRQTDTDPP